MATELAGAARDGDLVARLGGEEFGVLLADCRLNQAQAVAERLREAVERLALPHGGLPGHALVTVSLGLALAQPDAGGAALTLADRAGAALYLVKHNDRNCWAKAA